MKEIKFVEKLNPKYTEILRLARLLIDRKVPFTLKRLWDGYAVILLNEQGEYVTDAVQHKYSYGSANNLLETWQADGADVEGHASAEEVLAIWEIF